MCDEYKEIGRAVGEELWLMRSGKVIEGQFEVQIEECIVDSGASASTSHTARGLINQRPSELYFKGLTGITNGVTDGVANVYFYDPMEPATPGGAVQLEQTVLPNTEQPLISVSQLCEAKGFTQVIRPSYEGPCGFYKTESDGRQTVLPFALNKERGLYIATYVVGSSVAEAQRRAHKLHEIMVVTVHAEGHVTGTASNVADIEEIDLDDPVLEEEEGEVVDGDEAVDINDRGPAIHHSGGLYGEDDESDDVLLPEGIVPEHEPVLSRSARRGLTKLSSLERHRKLGHLGFHPKCPVCFRLRKKRRLTMTKSPRIDMIGDRTMVVDSIYWSNKDCDGNQYTTCGRCQRSGFVVKVHMQTRAGAGVKLLEEIEYQRIVLQNPQFVRCIYLDAAGEWHTDNAEFSAKMDSMDPPVQVIMLQTQCDKRANGAGEGLMYLIEYLCKAMMIDTRLEIERYTWCVDHAVWVINRTCMQKRMGPRGDGPRPLMEVTNWTVTADDCDHELEASVPPGSLCMCRLSESDRPKGSHLHSLSNFKYGRAVKMEGATIVMQDPYNLSTKFREYKDYELVSLPVGQSALTYLSLQTPELPNACLPRSGDATYSGPGMHVVVLSSLVDSDLPVVKATLQLLDKRAELEGTVQPKTLTVDKNLRVWEPLGENGTLVPTTSVLKVTESDETTVKLESDAESITRLQDMMSYQPDYFVGRYVYKYFEASKSKEAGVFMGLVLDCDEREGRPGQFVWLVHYTDGFREDFDHEDMFRSGISFADGRMTSGDGALRSESDHRRDLQRLVGKYAIEKEMRWIRLAQEELMQLDSKRVYYKTAQGKVRHGIYDAIAGTVGGKAKPNPRGIYATLKEATANKHMPKGETDVEEGKVRTGGGGVKSDEESDDEGGPDIDNSFYWTAEDDTWTDVMLHFGIEDDERQKLYFKWLKEEWKMGNKPEFRSDPGATHFFNPIKQKGKKASSNNKIEQKFKADTAFPEPAGSLWECFCRKEAGGDTQESENTSANKMHEELLYGEVVCEVWLDYKDLQYHSNDARMPKEESKGESRQMHQIHLRELVDKGELEDVVYADVDKEYFDEAGLPIAPKNIESIMSRKHTRKMWIDAVNKETGSLKKAGVFQFGTYKEFMKSGHISQRKKPVPMRMLLSSKVDTEGNFTKAKARAVIQGDKRHMHKGIHYSVVYCPSPSLDASRVLQAYATGENKHVFAGDVVTAFLHADTTPEERVVIRMPEGCREFDENGDELYGLLVKNCYGSPQAPRNWTLCRDKFLQSLDNRKGWSVKNMIYEATMWKIVHNLPVALRAAAVEAEKAWKSESNAEKKAALEIIAVEKKIAADKGQGASECCETYIDIHTDDVDGVTDDPRGGKLLMDALDEEFGMTVQDPHHMLGINRETTRENGVTTLKLKQVAYIEAAWALFGEHRGGKQAPKTPADGLKFTDDDGRLIMTSEKEYKEVTDRGYRKLIGTMLWPARNCYPLISYALSQLSRSLEKPSEAAWKSAMHTMHYLYANRHAGIGYTSDGNREPIAWYDSGHMQDRVDYKSQYGYVIMWFGGPLCWISKKHNHVGESSAEDEYMALNHCYKKAKWLISLFEELGWKERFMPVPMELRGDNKQAGRWGRENMITNGNRFIERMYMKVREGVRNGDILPVWIETALNISDVLTKAVPREIVEKLAPIMVGMEEQPPLGAQEFELKAESDARIAGVREEETRKRNSIKYKQAEKKRMEAYESYYRPNFLFDKREVKGHMSDETKYDYFGLSEGD